MVKVEDIERTVRSRGIASTLQAAEVVPVYSEAVQRFLRDNKSLGENWQEQVASYLFDGFKGVDDEVNLVGSNSYSCVAMTSLAGIPLITGKQLLGMWESAGRKNPFGNRYIDFGIQANGELKTNSVQAGVLLKGLKNYNLKEEVLPDFCQLNLFPDQNSGLVFRIADDVEAKDLTPVSAYLFEGRVGKNGLFRAYLYSDLWYAIDDNLASSNVGGRVVRYDAEGVVPKKNASDTARDLTEGFLLKFK